MISEFALALSEHSWLGASGDEILRGSIGLGTAPVTISADQSSVSIAGELTSVNIDEWISLPVVAVAWV